MKHFLRFFTFILAFFSCITLSWAQLSGTYTIDPSGSGGTNYTSFTAAVSALNSNGVSGNVVFKVASRSFSENISINAFTNSGTYTVVFQGAGRSNTTITSSSSSGTVSLNGGDKITFRDMTIATTAYQAVYMASTSDDCSFRNCNLKGYSISSTSNTYAVVYLSGVQARRLTIDSCDVLDGSYGLYIYGSSSSYLDRFTLSNSRIKGYYYRGIYLYYNEAAQVLNNIWEIGSYTSAYTLYAVNCRGASTNPFRINGNKFLGNAYIMYLSSCSGYSTAIRNEMYNNVIQAGNTSNRYYTCYMSSCSYWNIYHNSFASHSTSTTTSYSCLYGSGSYLDIQNNNFISSGNYLLYLSSSTGLNEDYNNFYRWSGSGAIYKAGSSTPGSNSVSVHQGWASLSDLSIKDGCVNGSNLTSVVGTDVDGKTRNNPPDIGAYEASSGNNDAGVAALISPSIPLGTGTQTVTVKVKNYGGNNLTQFTVNYQLGSGSPVSQTFAPSTALAPCASDNYTMTTGFTPPTSCTGFKVWTSSPNSTTDPVNGNDTLYTQFGQALSGTYTVYGSSADFSSLSAALDVLKCSGMSGVVTLKLAAGTYTGQIMVPPIPGASSSNRLVVQGAGVSNTKLTYSQSSSTAHRATLSMDGCSFIEFRDMTIEATNTSYGWAVQIGNSRNCRISNCALLTGAVSTSNVIPLVLGGTGGTSYSTGGDNLNVTIDSSLISGGYFAVTNYGGSSAGHRNTTIDHCTIEKYYYYGVYSYYCPGFTFTNNLLDYGSYNYQYVYGLTIYNPIQYSTGPFIFNNNTIRSYGYAMYLGYLNNTASQPGQIMNNMMVGGNASYPLYMFASGSTYPCRNWQIYHNSLNSRGAASYGWYMSDVDSFDFRNNIINQEAGGSYCFYSSKAPNGSSIISDYNNYYGTSNLVYYAGTTLTASNLNSSTNYDAHSVTRTTPFISSTDLHLSDPCFARGTSISAAGNDIDGQTRSSQPHLGCDEYPTGTLDIGITALLSPNGSVSSGTQKVKFAVMNFGTTGVDSFYATYLRNGSSAVTERFVLSNTLNNCEKDTVEFATSFNFTSGCSDIRVWTSKPNGSTDNLPANDSSNKVSFGIGLAGTYTVGNSSSDFATLQDALDKLACAGAAGHVILKLAPDTVQGPWIIPAYQGLSASATLTIDGQGNFLVTNSVTSSTADFATLVFNDAQFTTIRGMKIEGKGTYAYAVQFRGNSGVSSGVSNCIISVPQGSSSSQIPVVLSNSLTNYSTSGKWVDCFVDSCTISGGYFGIVGYSGQTAVSQRFRVDHCSMDKVYYYGIYLNQFSGTRIRHNTIKGFGSISSYGIYIYDYYYTGSVYSSNLEATLITHNWVEAGYPIEMDYVNHSSSDPGLIANNMLHSTYIYGIYFGGTSSYPATDYWNVYNNTIYMDYNSPSTFYGIYNYYGDYHDTRNNIIHLANGSSSSYCYYAYYSYNTRGLDYNNYYNKNGFTLLYVRDGSSLYTVTSSNLNTYSGSSFDVNSINVVSPFVSGTNWHLTDACFKRGASVVSDDIDGDSRSSLGPHLGADEVPTASLDAGVSAILSPAGAVASGSQTVSVVVSNYGSTALSQVTVNYQSGSNSGSQTFSFTPNLSACQKDTLTFTTGFSISNGCHEIQAWTSAPNNSTDGIPANDTASGSFGIPMAGTYTIGPSGDYVSFNAALAALNCAGINGAVIFNVAQGTYKEKLAMGAIAGVSTSNTVTFQSAASNTKNPKMEYSSTGSSDNFVLDFNGSSYITFNGIDLINNGASYANVVQFTNVNSYISILNGLISSNPSVSAYGVYEPSGNAPNNNITISGNTFEGSYYGIYAYGQSTASLNNSWSILNNIFKGYRYMACYLYYHNGLRIEGNHFIAAGSTPYGLYMYYCDGPSRILANRFEGQTYGYGIYQYYNDASSSAPAIIANNFISVGDGSSYARPIYSYYSSYQKFYHNSLYAAHSSSYASSSYATAYFYYSSSSYAGNEFINNNVVNGSGGYVLYHGSTTYSYLASDYNNYYSKGAISNIIYSGADYSSLAAYSSARSLDGNSKDVDPKYYSTKDLHALSSVLDSAGTSLTAVTVDIDGESRNSSTPSVGADEYRAIDHDAGVVAILMPEIICTSNTAVVKLQNFGNLNLQSVTINWSVDGTSQSAVSWTGNLVQGATEDVSLGNFSGGSGTGPVQIEAWTSSPNSQTDLNPQNDSSSTILGRGVSGTYTIAQSGGDFSTFNDALDFVKQSGLCGDVVFNVKEGTWTERLDIPDVKGSSPSATLTFRSAPGNGSMPVLQFASIGSGDYFVVRFNSADNIVFDGIHVRNTGSSASYGSAFAGYRSNVNKPHNIVIRNCKIEAVSANTTSTYNAAINFYGGLNAYTYYEAHNILIENNDILNGAYGGIWFYGSSTALNKNIMIRNNRISNGYYTGIWCYYTDSITLEGNTITMGPLYTSANTVYIQYCNGRHSIVGNRITAPNTANTNYGLTMQYCASSSGKESVVANNFISCPSTTSVSQTAGGFWYNSYMNVYHNNFYIGNGAGSTNTGSAAFFYNTSATTGYLNVYNNVFQADGSGNMAAWYYFIANPTSLKSDYNSYYGTYRAYSGTAYTTLAAMSAASGTDSNSMDANPFYNSGSDLHVNQQDFYMAGMPLGFIIDIDSNSRPTTPTIGAHEISPDISALAIWSDTLCGHDRADGPVHMTLRNDGDIVMREIAVGFQVDGGTPTTEVLSGSTLAKGETKTFTLSSLASFAGYADFVLKGWTSSPDVDRSGDTATGLIPYWPYPTNAFTHADTCYGDDVSFTNTSSISKGSIVSYGWNFGDGGTSILSNPVHGYSGSGTYSVQLTSISDKGCTDTINNAVRVMTDLLAGSVGAAQTICYGFAPSTLNSVADASQSAGTYSYQWQESSDDINWADISAGTSNSFAPGNLTTTTYYRREVRTSIGCGPKYTASVKITVYNPMQAGSVTGDQSICYNTAPSAIAHATAPTGGDGTWTYNWERSTDQSNWSRISGATSTSYQPGKLTQTTWYRRVDIGGSGCGEVITAPVKVNVYAPVDGGIVGPDHESCPNTAPDLLGTSQSASGGDGTYTYQWQISPDKSTWTDISSATSESYQHGILSATSYFRRQATSGSGCGSNYSKVATVSMAAVPKASFAASNHCFNDVLPLTNLSSIAKGNISQYLWDLGDGNSSSDASPKHTYQKDGQKTIKLKVTSNIGCVDSTTRTVTVSNIPTPAFSHFYDCNVDSIRFKNTTSVNCGKIDAFHWDFGDGSKSNLENPAHVYASSGTYLVKLVIDLPGGFSDSVSRQVSQFARSTASFTVDDVCFGENVTFNNKSTNAVSYDWDFDDNNLSNLTSPSHFYRVIGTYKVKLKAYDGNGCYEESTATVTVKVKPVAYFTTDNRCHGDSTPFFNGTDYGDTYKWDFGDNMSSTAVNPMHLYTNPGAYDITLYAFNNNGCKDTSYGKASVWTLPSAAFSVGSGCVGEQIQFSNSSSTVAQYIWDFGDGQNSTGRDVAHVYGNAGTYTVTLDIITLEGCSSRVSHSVTVYDNPVADFSNGDVCLGTPTVFTNKSTLKSGSMGYHWDFGDGGSSSATGPSHTYASAGTYTVTLVVTASGGCTDTMWSTVKVNVQPLASFSASTACAGEPTVFSNNSGNATSYVWTFGDGNSSTDSDPKHTYGAAGTYTVTLKAIHSGGCESTSTSSVTVNPVPVASFTASTVCAGSATVFTNSSSVSSGTLSYNWDFGDGTSSTASGPSHTYAGAGTYVAVLTVTTGAGCTSKTSVSVTVNPNPVADFTVSNVCLGNATSFSNYSTGGNSYSWNFGDGSSASNAQQPSHTYAAAGTYTAQLTVTNTYGCSSSKSVNAVVYAKPTADFSQSSTCPGTAMNFSNSSSAGTYLWLFGDGGTSTATSPSHTYAKSGNYNVTLNVTNSFGCENNVTKAVSVYAEPKAAFTSNSACLGTATSFSNQSSGAVSYAWTFGDGRNSTQVNPSNTYAAAGTYKVVLVATSANGCTNTYESNVSVYANPTASFTANDACLGELVYFTNTSSTGASGWNFGDGSSANTGSPAHSYAAAGNYTVQLTVTNANGCKATYSRNVKVSAKPAISFTSSALCSGNQASFTNTSTGANAFNWNFGDGQSSTQSDPTHTYASGGTYTVRLNGTSADGCKSSAEGQVTVYPAAVADFSAAGVCAGQTTTFLNNSRNAVNTSWNFGDGNSSSNPSPTHTYAGSGNYNVTLQVENALGCKTQVTKAVSVYVNPVSSFTAANGCEGDVLNFTNNSTNGASYLWNFGDGNSSTAMAGSHTYKGSGARTISLKVISANGCTHESSRTIDVYERPFANFTVDNTCEGDLTRFVNTSLNGASYSWAFGDGGTSTNANPTHQYAKSGSFTASLTANNANCADTYNLQFSINAAPDAGFSFNVAGRDVSFTANSATSMSKYEWDFNDGSGSAEANPKHVFGKAIQQSFDVCLRVTDLNGCAAQSCADVAIDILGTKDVQRSNFTIYPNPTQGVFHIQFGQIMGDMSIELMDMVGNVVRVPEMSVGSLRYTLDISDFAEGIYLVRVKNGQMESTQRIMLSK